MVKKHFRLLNRSILRSELGVRHKLRFWAQMSSKQSQKNLTARNSASEVTNPLEMVKKTCQASESLNYDVRARSYELGPKYDVGPRWAGNRHEKSDFNEFSFWAHQPLRNGKKTYQAFESLNSDVRARSSAQITILGQEKQETDAKNRTSTNLASQLTNPYKW